MYLWELAKSARLLKASELATGVLKNSDVVAKGKREDITKAQARSQANRFTKVLR
jgi:hypothetical protein